MEIGKICDEMDADMDVDDIVRRLSENNFKANSLARLFQDPSKVSMYIMQPGILLPGEAWTLEEYYGNQNQNKNEHTDDAAMKTSMFCYKLICIVVL